MISSTMYTPERINNFPCELNLPVKIFKEINRSVPTPIAQKGKFFALNEENNLISYDEISGDVLWKSKVNDLRLSLPIVHDNQIIMEDSTTNEGVVISLSDGSVASRLEVINANSFPSWSLKKDKLYTVTSNRGAKIREQLVCRMGAQFDIEWTFNDFSFKHYAVSDNYILLNDKSGNVVALDTKGQELWRLSPLDTGLFASQQEVDAIPRSKPGFFNLNQTLGYPMIYQNRIGIVPMLDNHFIGIDLATGKVLWARKVERSHNWIRQGYCDEIYCLSSQYIEAFNLETGEQTKKVAIDASYIKESLGKEMASFTQFAVSETYIFAASSIMQYMSAINIRTGKVEWTFVPENAITDTDQPYVANGRVYYPCLRKMYIFEGPDGYIAPVE